MAGTCTDEVIANLNACMRHCFTRRPPREDKDKPRVLKTAAEIANARRTIFDVRRRGEPDNAREIQDPNKLADTRNNWMQE